MISYDNFTKVIDYFLKKEINRNASTSSVSV